MTKIDVSRLQQYKTQDLREMREPVIVTDVANVPLAVIFPYEQYLEIQRVMILAHAAANRIIGSVA